MTNVCKKFKTHSELPHLPNFHHPYLQSRADDYLKQEEQRLLSGKDLGSPAELGITGVSMHCANTHMTPPSHCIL